MRSCLKKKNESRHSLLGLSPQEAEAGELPDPRSSSHVVRLLSQDKTKASSKLRLKCLGAEAGRLLGVGGQPGLHSKSLFQREKTKDLRKSKP